jgi:hypothetical protein
MKSTLLISRISQKAIAKHALVLMLLLSFLGQAFASVSVCVMSIDNSKSLLLEVPLKVALEAPLEAPLPCHSIMTEDNVDEASSSELPSAMDCCDDHSIAMDHDCGCPDGSCSASMSFSSQEITSSFTYSEQANSYSQLGFPTQISSALFRPPIV